MKKELSEETKAYIRYYSESLYFKMNDIENVCKEILKELTKLNKCDVNNK